MVQSKSMTWLAAGCIALAAALTGYTNAATAAGADEAAIRAQTTNWGKAYNAGDAKAVAALYADDAILQPPGAPGAKGRAAILAFLTKDIAGAQAAGVVFVLDPKTDVGVSGNMGWESGRYTATVKGAVVEISLLPSSTALAQSPLYRYRRCFRAMAACRSCRPTWP